MEKRISVQQLLDNFPFKILHKYKPKTIFITSTGVSRVGIYLANPFKNDINRQYHGCILFGRSELDFFANITEEEIRKKIQILEKMNPPLIIFNKSWNKKAIDIVLKYIKNEKANIVWIDMDSTAIYFILSPYIAKNIAPTTTIHGTLVSIYGVGTLITGDSGSGKSEATMELIKKGHLFIADDAVEVYNFGQQIFGHSSEVGKHYIEVRGLGILNIGRMFGKQVTLPEINIQLVIHLVNPNSDRFQLNNFERIGTNQRFENISGVKIVKYDLPIQAGRSMSNLIESAVIDFKLKEGGYNSADEYIANYNKIIEREQKK